MLRGVTVSPRMEVLVVVILTGLTAQHWMTYVGVLLLYALILPSARMGMEKSFLMDGVLPFQIWLLRLLIPFAVLIATVEFFGVGNFLKPLCPEQSLCGLASHPIKGFVFWYYANSVFVYSLLRANYTFKPFSFFHTIIAVAVIPGAIFVLDILHIAGNSYPEMLVVSAGIMVVSYFSYGCLAGFVAFVFSFGRRDVENG